MTNATNTHPLDLAVRLDPGADGSFAGKTHPAYGNMVGPFGGLIAATLLNAAMAHPARIGDPLALTVNFTAPIADGTFSVEAIPVRTNRSTQHSTIALLQGGEVVITATAVFAKRRDTWSTTESGFPEAPSWDTLTRSPPIDGIAWTHRYDMRFARGGRSDVGNPAGDPSSVSSLWVRDCPPRPLDFLSLTAICDVFYPRIFVRRPRIVPVGTVSMTVYFHADAELLLAQGTRPVLATARASHFGKGYHDQVAEIWSKDGILLASSHQIVYFKE